MLSIPALLLTALLAPATVVSPRDVRAQVDQALQGWLAEHDDSELTERLVALGVEAEPYLCELLAGDLGAAPVEALATALGRVGGATSSVEPLAALLGSSEASRRAWAATALGELGREAAVSGLLVVLDDPHVSVRSAAGSALLAIEQSHLRLDLASELLPMRRDLEHTDHFALLLGRLGTPPALEQLHQLLGDWSDERAILDGLAGLWIGGTLANAPPVRELLTGSDSPAIRRKACLVLGKFKDGSSTRALLDCLHDEDQRGLVADAHWALLQITGLQLDAKPALWEIWWERVGQAEHGRSGGG